MRSRKRNSIRPISILIVISFIVLIGSDSSLGRDPKTAAQSRIKNRPSFSALASLPGVMYASQNRGLMQLAIANNGTFGTFGSNVYDPFTGGTMMSCTYPRGDDKVYLWVGAFWIGAVVGRDTLVSTGSEDFYVNSEFWADLSPWGDIQIKSIDINSPYFDTTAYSEQDILCEYTDTFTNSALVDLDLTDNRPHRPLGIKVKQRSMAWAYAYADDFILFDYEIQNIGQNHLRGVYMGIWVDGDVWHVSRNGPDGWNDDMVGFYRTHPAPEGCGFIDTVDVAWTADADGDPDGGEWDYRSARNVVGIRVVRTPSDSLEVSFNWWIINYTDASQDFGPRLAETEGDPFRFFPSGRLGTAEGDRDKYYLLRHKEFDYDLLETGLDHTLEGFLPRPAEAATYAMGYDTRYLLSFGPFNIDPGQSLPISFCWVGGEYLHRDPTAFQRLFGPTSRDSVKQYIDALDFSNLALNSRWASWVYDNPGKDTDGDGYTGKFRICYYDSILSNIDTIFPSETPWDTIIDTTYEYTLADTFYYEGDGVPDFEGASPPPAPKMRIIPGEGKLTVRWNGYYSETTRDPFLQVHDFEGYRVHMGLDDRLGSLSLISSYDIEDYNRFHWTNRSDGSIGWVLEDAPFTPEQLRTYYNDPTFDPRNYPRDNPLSIDGTLYYFEPQDFNQSELNLSHGIRKAFPNARYPGPDSAEWRDEDMVDGYDQPMPRYWEYEYVLDNLLPTLRYYVSVTVFDYGAPGAGLDALESNPLNNLIAEYPMISSDTVEAYGLDAYVYPNPYIGDGRYAARGYEGRDNPLFGPGDTERIRRLHFANLPRKCTIGIYSLDGDLIREWEHHYPQGGPGSNHSTWDLITRNTQAIVSGIYYWVVRSETRTQLGKFVILL